MEELLYSFLNVVVIPGAKPVDCKLLLKHCQLLRLDPPSEVLGNTGSLSLFSPHLQISFCCFQAVEILKTAREITMRVRFFPYSKLLLDPLAA